MGLFLLGAELVVRSCDRHMAYTDYPRAQGHEPPTATRLHGLPTPVCAVSCYDEELANTHAINISAVGDGKAAV